MNWILTVFGLCNTLDFNPFTKSQPDCGRVNFSNCWYNLVTLPLQFKGNEIFMDHRAVGKNFLPLAWNDESRRGSHGSAMARAAAP